MSIFTSNQPLANTGSYAPGEIRWASKPVTPISAGWKEVRPQVVDLVVKCSDNSVRKLRLNLPTLDDNQKAETRLMYRVLQDAIEGKKPLLFSVKGNNSERHWFCGFTEDFIEVETKLPSLNCPF